MDYTCIRTQKVSQLETTAKLSTVQLVECDEYIRLAMCVEHYIADPSDTHFNAMKEQLSICTDHFPKFNQSRQALIANLLNIGYMVKDTPPPTSSNNTKIQLKKEEHSDKPKNNVVDLFTKKNVDLPK